tara:strand:+ start:674 stop:856 length:183 start_codon:yes stop_codon:yes gene_type:complete
MAKAKISGISIHIGEFSPTDEGDRIIVDYNDNTQKILLEDTDVSKELTKVKDIHAAFFKK